MSTEPEFAAGAGRGRRASRSRGRRARRPTSGRAAAQSARSRSSSSPSAAVDVDAALGRGIACGPLPCQAARPSVLAQRVAELVPSRPRRVERQQRAAAWRGARASPGRRCGPPGCAGRRRRRRRGCRGRGRTPAGGGSGRRAAPGGGRPGRRRAGRGGGGARAAANSTSEEKDGEIGMVHARCLGARGCDWPRLAEALSHRMGTRWAYRGTGAQLREQFDLARVEDQLISAHGSAGDDPGFDLCGIGSPLCQCPFQLAQDVARVTSGESRTRRC